MNFGNPTWPQTVETVGDAEAKQPSFSHQLVLNAIAWVSEPSQKLTDFGTRKIPVAAPPVHWHEKVQLPPPAKTPNGPIALQRGIIGVTFSLSDGRGSVEDYAQAAAAAKLQFLVFAESLEHLSADKWQTLVKKCQELSQKGLVYLVPGYEYEDINGLAGPRGANKSYILDRSSSPMIASASFATATWISHPTLRRACS